MGCALRIKTRDAQVVESCEQRVPGVEVNDGVTVCVRRKVTACSVAVEEHVRVPAERFRV